MAYIVDAVVRVCFDLGDDDMLCATHVDVPACTINGRLDSLFHSGHVTDHHTEDSQAASPAG